VRRLEAGLSGEHIGLEPRPWRQRRVESIEDIQNMSAGVQGFGFRRIEKTAARRAVDREEIADSIRASPHGQWHRPRLERAETKRRGPSRSMRSQSRSRDDVGNETGLVAIFGRRNARGERDSLDGVW